MRQFTPAAPVVHKTIEQARIKIVELGSFDHGTILPTLEKCDK